MEKKLTIENKLEQLTLLSGYVEELCEELNLGPELVFNFNLVLEEAMTNVVMYAYPEGETHTIDLTATLQGKELVFVLKDTGTPFDPTQVPDVDTSLSAEEREIGGLGIFLIKQIMDRVEYQYIDNHNVLTMAKNI